MPKIHEGLLPGVSPGIYKPRPIGIAEGLLLEEKIIILFFSKIIIVNTVMDPSRACPRMSKTPLPLTVKLN